MDTTSDAAVAEVRAHSVERARWRQINNLVIDSFAVRFTRIEPAGRAAGFVTGLLAGLQIRYVCDRVAGEYRRLARPGPIATEIHKGPADRAAR